MAIVEKREKDKKGNDAFVLTITNGHKDEIDKIIDAYKIKDKDPSKVIAFLLQVASQKDNLGKPLGTSIGGFYIPPKEWVVE